MDLATLFGAGSKLIKSLHKPRTSKLRVIRPDQKKGGEGEGGIYASSLSLFLFSPTASATVHDEKGLGLIESLGVSRGLLFDPVIATLVAVNAESRGGHDHT